MAFLIPLVMPVSIHAPIRVRLPFQNGCWFFDRFQSTHPYGCDSLSFTLIDTVGCFNPRTHTGATRDPHRCSHRFPCFNPRTHTGATTSLAFSDSALLFQSTHPYGCDDEVVQGSPRGHSFNPRTHTGATFGLRFCDVFRQFQSTHPYGCDCDASSFGSIQYVSIHAPIRVRRLAK